MKFLVKIFQSIIILTKKSLNYENYHSFFILFSLIISGWSSQLEESPSLAKKYSEYFPVGAAVGGGHLDDYDTPCFSKNILPA
ncbi:MAG: hypothetical protein ACOCWA_03165 [Bacteroidota bacterium]